MPTDNLDPEIDWAKRADGETHTLTQGEHYTRPATLVRRAAGAWAARHGFRCLTDIASGGDRITVQFVPKREKV